MRAVVLLLTVVLTITFLGCGPSMVQVQSGERVVCSECGKLIRSDVTTTQVPVAEASKYSVHEVKELCPECQAKEAARERQQSIGRVTGGWIWNVGAMGSVVIKLNADGTGSMGMGNQSDPFTWRSTADGFTASIMASNYGGPKSLQQFSGRVFENGKKLNVTGYGFFGFGNSQSSVFDRMN